MLPCPDFPSQFNRKRLPETAAFCAALALYLALVFEWNSRPSANRFYLFFLPVIWIAVRQGLRGAIPGLLALNVDPLP